MSSRLLLPRDGLGWQARAACRDLYDLEVMFPATVAGLFDALAVCAGCPVRPACAAYAVDSGQRHGVWGGLSERDLRAAVRDGHPPGAPPPAPTPIPARGPDPRRGVAAARARAGALARACGGPR